MIFIDTSALAKRYVEEPGSEEVRTLMEQADCIAVSRLAYAETLSALFRRRHAIRLSDEDFALLIRDFRADWEDFSVVEMNADTLKFVDSVIEKHALRGADSIHLSTALCLRNAVKENPVFVASDKELLAAARKERFKTVNPQDSSSPVAGEVRP
jgi:predicted nucleic acid-binding protein